MITAEEAATLSNLNLNRTLGLETEINMRVESAINIGYRECRVFYNEDINENVLLEVLKKFNNLGFDIDVCGLNPNSYIKIKW